MTGNLILEHWSNISFIIAVAIQTLSEWYPVTDYIETWLMSKDPNLL
jgi:hypothetical protein